MKLESDIQDVKIRLDLAESEIQRVREAYEILTQSKAALESETDSYKCQIEKLLADLGELRAKNVEHLDLQKAADAKFGAELEILEEKVKDLEQQLKLAHLQQENYRLQYFLT